MKKINLLVALATTCALGMNAQTSEPLISGVNFSVKGEEPALNPFWQEGDEEEDKYLPNTWSIAIDSEINMEFVKYDATELTDNLGFHPYIMLQTGGGFAIDATFYALDDCKVNGNSSMYAFPMKYEEGGEVKYRWGNPYMGSFYATPMVCFLKLNGGDLPPVITQQDMAEKEDLILNLEFYSLDDEPVFFQQPSYTSENTFAPTLANVSPNEKWEDETFAEAYERGVISFSFTNPVGFKDASNVATIVYTMEDVDFEETVPQSACEIGWNRLDGYYAVTFTYASEDYPVEDLSKVSITLNGVTYTPAEGEPVDVKVSTVVLDNNVAAPAMRQKKSRIANEVVESNELVNVYNIQGMLVKEGVNKASVKELPAGLYIVDGKKVVVR